MIQPVRKFSVYIKPEKIAEEPNVFSKRSYTVLAIHQGPLLTHFLVVNDSAEFHWILSSQCTLCIIED